jgi:uncharacterized membrane protein YkoI
MLARNALVLAIATALTAGIAGAQAPASKAKSTATAQAPAAKSTAKTAAVQALPVSSDSAKKIVMANASGATVSSARLHKSAGKAWYSVTYKGADKKTMHATVDANTGAFTAAAPAAAKSTSKKPAK